MAADGGHLPAQRGCSLRAMVFRLAGPTARVDRRSRDEEARKTCTCIDVDLKIAANIGREAEDWPRCGGHRTRKVHPADDKRHRQWMGIAVFGAIFARSGEGSACYFQRCLIRLMATRAPSQSRVQFGSGISNCTRIMTYKEALVARVHAL